MPRVTVDDRRRRGAVTLERPPRRGSVDASRCRPVHQRPSARQRPDFSRTRLLQLRWEQQRTRRSIQTDGQTTCDGSHRQALTRQTYSRVQSNITHRVTAWRRTRQRRRRWRLDGAPANSR